MNGGRKNPVLVGPLTRRETRVYLPNVAGGFDLRDCPHPEWLAAQIVKRWNAYPRLVEFMRQFAELQGPDSHIRFDAEAFLRELGERLG